MASIIEPRAAWGARRPTSVTPRPLSHFQGIRVHHSGGSASASVRAIQNWDMDSKGLSDIGYSYIIRDGKVFEGRGTNHPAHDSLNRTFGVCIIGTYSSRLPSAADLDALVACIRELRAMTGRRLPVDGHRDARPNVTGTTCPGNALHAHLPTIRARADNEEDDMSWTDRWDKVDPTSGSSPSMLARNFLRWSHHHANEARRASLAANEKLDLLLGASRGESTQQLLERIDRHHAEQVARLDELGQALDEAAQERDELAELVRQAQSGERDANAVVDEIGRRLAGPADAA